MLAIVSNVALDEKEILAATEKLTFEIVLIPNWNFLICYVHTVCYIRDIFCTRNVAISMPGEAMSRQESSTSAYPMSIYAMIQENNLFPNEHYINNYSISFYHFAYYK